MTTLNEAYREGALWALDLIAQHTVTEKRVEEGCFTAGWRNGMRQAHDLAVTVREGVKIPRPYDEPPP